MRWVLTGLLLLCLSPWAGALDHAAQAEGPGTVPPRQRQKSEASSNFRPEAVNVFVSTDARLFIVMAALNMAGYNYESRGREVSPLRQQLRRKLATMDANLRARLVDYYKVHLGRQAEGPPRIGGYVGLSLVMSPPPTLSVDARRHALPKDVVAAADFAPLVREFYSRSGVAELIGPALQAYGKEIDRARQRIGVMVFDTLDYLHTLPVLTLREWAAPEGEASARRGRRKKDRTRHPRLRRRTRRLFVLLNPLDASDAASVRNDILNGADTETDRRRGDEYFVILGSRSGINLVRPAFLRFVLEPLSQRFAGAIGQQAAPIGHLAEQVIGAEAAQNETAFSIVVASLVWAVEARLTRLQVQRQWEKRLLQAQRRRDRAQSQDQRKLADAELRRIQAQAREEERLADDETVYDLSTHYEQGAVLTFHFYEKLIPWERAGVDIISYYDEMLRSINFEREAARPDAYRPVRARLEQRRQERRRAAVAASEGAKELQHANELIQKREFERARVLLRAILKKDPNNARAHYGLAQVVSQMASRIDPTRSPDPDAAWGQLMAQLGQAIEHYRRAIAAASPQQGKWLASQAHVAIGKILEFTGQRDAAAAEYRKAIELGDVPGGAYAQAKARLVNKH